MPSSTIGILLAAGESRRMGRLKALLPWQGTTLLGHQLASLLEAGVQQVIVVLGHRAKSLKPVVDGQQGAIWVVNPDYLEGKTTSLKAGLSRINPQETSNVLILNVDQPRSPGIIRRVLDSHPSGSSLISIPVYHRKGGHPVVISTALLGELLAITEDTQGLKAVMRRHEADTHRPDLDDPEILWDLNTPEDYQEAIRHQAQG